MLSFGRCSIRLSSLLLHLDLLLSLLHDLSDAHVVHIGGAEHGLVRSGVVGGSFHPYRSQACHIPILFPNLVLLDGLANTSQATIVGDFILVSERAGERGF